MTKDSGGIVGIVLAVQKYEGADLDTKGRNLAAMYYAVTGRTQGNPWSKMDTCHKYTAMMILLNIPGWGGGIFCKQYIFLKYSCNIQILDCLWGVNKYVSCAY